MDNCLKTKNAALEKYTFNLSSPHYCCFSISMKCLFSCKTCYIWKQKEDFSQELPIEKWKEAVEHLTGFLDQNIDIIITGGEPLLKAGILDLIRSCSRMGYRISLQTNAFLIDEELAKKLEDAGLWRVGISLYSLRGEVHDFLRGRQGAYERVSRAIDNLARFAPGIGINIQTLIMEINLEDLVSMAEWVENDGRLDYILYLVPMLPFGAEKDDAWFTKDTYRLIWPQDPGRANAICDELIDKKNYFKKIANPILQLQAFKRYFDRSLAYDKTECTMGLRGINMDPAGNVFLCFLKEPIGNIRENNLGDIWGSQRAEEIRMKMGNCQEKCHFLLNCSFRERDLIR